MPKNFFAIHTGYFDLTSMDQRSDKVSDIFDYSKNFYLDSDSLLPGKAYYYGNQLEKRKKLNSFFTTRLGGLNVWTGAYGVSFLTKEKFSTPTGYRETRGFVNDLLNRHASKLDKTKRNIYVFIGTSATAPIIAFSEALKQHANLIRRPGFLKNLDKSVFIDIPYSFEILKEHAKGNLSEKDLFAHFSNYVDPSIIEGNNLIFVDLAMSGLNIGSFMRNFKKFLISSGVQEASLSSDIFTFLPYNLQNSFLHGLRNVEGMNVNTPWGYWHYLMKNLYYSGYDDIFTYYDYKLNENYPITRSDIYSHRTMVDEKNSSQNIYVDDPTNPDSKVGCYGSSDIKCPTSTYSVSFDEKTYMVSSKYDANWMDYIKTNTKVPVSFSYINLKEEFSKVIENDLFFTSSSSCIFLFGN